MSPEQPRHPGTGRQPLSQLQQLTGEACLEFGACGFGRGFGAGQGETRKVGGAGREREREREREIESRGRVSKTQRWSDCLIV